MTILIINQDQNIMFKYHHYIRVLRDFPQSQRVELATHVGHYKHGKQEKKIQDVSP